MAKPKMALKIRQEMFAHWVQSNNYRETARAFGCSYNTVKNVVTDMPEYYAREHEHQRLEFVREAWLLARRALREIDRRLADGQLKDVSVAFGIIAQRATHAMYAAQKARLPDLFINNQQQIVQRGLTADEMLIAITQARKELAARERPGRIEAEVAVEE